MKHTHQYIRKREKEKEDVFRCAHASCNHYLRKGYVEGKKSICNRCGNEFILTKKELKMAKPHCMACGRGKEGTKIKVTEQFVEELMKELR